MNWVKFDEYWHNLDCYETVYVDACYEEGITTYFINGRLAFEKDEDGENSVYTLSNEYDTKEEAESLLQNAMKRFRYSSSK